ncbi:MAG: hypothetical protein E6767_04915 [Dysgonomonas sp.]|nr:hypothetical protein [Dysgonomonas sp.]
MKKYLLFLMMTVFLASFFVACSDDDDPKPGEEVPTDLTPEEIKTEIANDAQALLTKMKGLNNSKGLELMSVFANLFEAFNNQETPDYGRKVKKSTGDILLDSDFYGEYSWDSVNSEWTLSKELADKLVFVLPASSTSMEAGENDGKIEITRVDSDVEKDGHKIPKSVNAVLYVNNINVGTIALIATGISLEQAPASVDMKLTLEAYVLDMNVTKGAESKSTFSFKNGSETLIDGYANLTADVDGSIKNDDLVGLGNAAAEVNILGNLSLQATGDLGKALKAVQAAEDKWDAVNEWTSAGEKAYVEEVAAAYNNNLTGKLVSKKDNKNEKFADAVCRVKEETYGSYKEYEEVLAFKFTDESVVDAGVYFGKGFDNVISQWMDFINKFN